MNHASIGQGKRFCLVRSMFVRMPAKEDNEKNAQSRVTITAAVREGNVDRVRTYLEGGGDVNLSSPSTGRTPLHIACRQVSVKEAPMNEDKGSTFPWE